MAYLLRMVSPSGEGKRWQDIEVGRVVQDDKNRRSGAVLAYNEGRGSIAYDQSIAGGMMGRIREYIKVNGKKFWTLFDSGARNTYVVPEVASLLAQTKMPKPFRSALSGTVRKTTTAALLVGKVQGHQISTNALVVADIGLDEDAKPIEVLFGALAMQQWGIRLVLAEERLDFTFYPKECVEY